MKEYKLTSLSTRYEIVAFRALHVAYDTANLRLYMQGEGLPKIHVKAGGLMPCSTVIRTDWKRFAISSAGISK